MGTRAKKKRRRQQERTNGQMFHVPATFRILGADDTEKNGEFVPSDALHVRSDDWTREAWRHLTRERYERGLSFLHGKDVKMPYNRDEFMRWLRGIEGPQVLIANHQAFSTLIGETCQDGESACLSGVPMPDWLRETYVTVCIAYNAARDPGMAADFSSLGTALRSIYPSDTVLQTQLDSPFRRALKRKRFHPSMSKEFGPPPRSIDRFGGTPAPRRLPEKRREQAR